MAHSGPDARQDWDRVASQLALRAEELDDPIATFVDTTFLEALKARHNQIIYGRRGTGKTHLFKRIEAELTETFEALRLVPIYVNGAQLWQQATLVTATPSATALAVYVKFVESLTSSLLDFVTSQAKSSWWGRLVGSPGATQSKAAHQIAHDLFNLLTTGQIRILPSGDASTEARTVNEAIEKAAASTGLSINIADPRSLGWKIGADLAASREQRRTGVSTLHLKGDVILPFNEVSRKLHDLLGLLGNSSLVVLFDEWSDIEMVAQPYLADMMKRTFTVLGDMHVKLACIPGRTRLATPVTTDSVRPLGYEEGDDIVADVNLDQVVFVDNDLSQLLTFLVALLKRHTGASLAWASEMTDDTFTDFICNQVFQDQNVFAELCQASGGVPRDFLSLMRGVTSVPRPGDHRVQILHVRLAAKALYEGKRNSFKDATDKPLDLLDEIYKCVVAREHSYFFLVKEGLADDPKLSLLFTEKLIHRIPVTYYDDSSHQRYTYFQIDYGTSVDLLMSRSDQPSGKNATERTISNMMDKYSLSSWIGNTVASSFAEEIAEQFVGQYLASESPGGRLDVSPRKLIVDSIIERASAPKRPVRKSSRSRAEN